MIKYNLLRSKDKKKKSIKKNKLRKYIKNFFLDVKIKKNNNIFL